VIVADMKSLVAVSIAIIAVAALSCAQAQEENGSTDSETTQRVHPREDSPIAFGVNVSLESNVLDETRILNIYLPPSYDTATEETYPVIYLLDGGVHEDYHHRWLGCCGNR
jgi:enterochelin esterase-like enzyme